MNIKTPFLNYRAAASITMLLLGIVSILLSKPITSAHSSQPTLLAGSLAITPISWGSVGLDSNDVTAGPNVFPVGARVCNTGDQTATNLQSSFVWDSANAQIGLRS